MAQFCGGKRVPVGSIQRELTSFTRVEIVQKGMGRLVYIVIWKEGPQYLLEEEEEKKN